MSTDRATPRPWDIAPHAEGDDLISICADYRDLGNGNCCAAWIAECDACNLSGSSGENEANAELIVRAVNSHEALVSALEELLCASEDEDGTESSAVALSSAWDSARKALAAVRDGIHQCECCKHKEPLSGAWHMDGANAYCSVACLTYHTEKTCGCFSLVQAKGGKE